MVATTCPACGSAINLPDGKHGRFTCPICDSTFTLPREDPITAAIKQVHRDNWEKIQTEVLSRLDKLLRGVNPNG